MGLFDENKYLVKIDKDNKSVELSPYKCKGSKKEIKKMQAYAESIVDVLEQMCEKHDVSEEVMYSDFLIGTKNGLVSVYKGKQIDNEGLDYVRMSKLTPSEKVAKHEGAHMAHRRALEDFLEKNPESYDKIMKKLEKVKPKHGLLERIVSPILKLNAKREKAVCIDDSERLFSKLYSKDMGFAEGIANQYGELNNANKALSAFCFSIGLLGSYGMADILVDATAYQESFSDFVDIIGEFSPKTKIGVMSIPILTIFMYDMALNAAESVLKGTKGDKILPDYLIDN